MSASIGLPLKKLNWANNGCQRCGQFPQKLFEPLRFFRMFMTGKIVFLAKGLDRGVEFPHGRRPVVMASQTGKLSVPCLV